MKFFYVKKLFFDRVTLHWFLEAGVISKRGQDDVESHDDRDENNGNRVRSHDLGRFCVLQPDLIEQKEISILFQMHFKLQRFFCSGQDTKAD